MVRIVAGAGGKVEGKNVEGVGVCGQGSQERQCEKDATHGGPFTCLRKQECATMTTASNDGLSLARRRAMTLCFRRFLTVMTIFVSCSALAADMGSKVTAKGSAVGRSSVAEARVSADR